MTLIKVNTRGQQDNLGRRNIIINGAMEIAQRAHNTASTGQGASSNFLVDRFKANHNGNSAGRYTVSRVADNHDGFYRALKYECTTADTSIAAGERFFIEQPIEGQFLQGFRKGYSDAKDFVVSFYAKANGNFTYVCGFYDADNNRTVSRTFAVTSSWQRFEINFGADTSGTFGRDGSLSLQLRWYLHAGSNYTSASLQTSWNAVNNAATAGGMTSSFFSSTDNTFFLTGVQLEVGDKGDGTSVATEFEHRSFGEELALCQRYHYRRDIGIYDIVAIGHALGDRGGYVLHTPTLMRAKPSVTQGSHIYCWYNNAGAVTAQNGLVVGYMANDAKDINQFYLRANSNSTVQTGYGLGLTMYDSSATSSHVALDSEL